jgi:hypothetical protein
MSLLTTSAASVHQLFAAAALAGPPSPVDDTATERTDGTRNVKRFWSKYEVVANTLLSVGWLIEQRTLRTQHDLDPQTNMTVSIKDICVAGVMLSNIANIVADQALKRELPEGVRLTSAGGLPADATAKEKSFFRYFNTMRVANRVFVAGAIGFTPLVNFNVLRSYRPSTIYRLFT